MTLNTPEVITAMSLGAACYLATVWTVRDRLAAVEARLRLVAPPKQQAQPAAEDAAADSGKTAPVPLARPA